MAENIDLDFPNLVWEMYAVSPEGEHCYCGSSDTAKGAHYFKGALEERGFTKFEKHQVLRENAGQSLLKRVM